MLGYEDLDLVGDLFTHLDSILKSQSKKATQQDGGGNLKSDLGPRILTREERERALRQQDLAHKSKPLGPKLADPALNYPHVYRAHDAGNILNVFGEKYRLPEGSRRLDEEVSYSLEHFAEVPGQKTDLAMLEILITHNTCT